MSGRDTRASRDLTHLSVAQLLNQPRGRGRGSRSPSPAPALRPAFFPSSATEDDWEENFADAIEDTMPIPADATPDEIRRLAEEAQQESRNMRAQQDRMTAALEAATKAAASATAALQALASISNSQATAFTAPPKRKRPELPALDKTNIHIWIQRVESAYAREEVTDPKQKFAFLESIIGVNLGPTINNYMFGDATAENWTAFLKHLKNTYGPTKENRCSVYLDGMKRNGLRPSDHLALIRDKAKEVSIDDLQKQLILRGLPPDVKKLLQDKVEMLDAAATATLADAHFEKDGRPLNSDASVSSIAQLQPQQPSPEPTNNPVIDSQPQDEPWTEVNAVRGRRARAPQQSGNNNQGRNNTNRPQFTPAFQSGSPESQARSSSRHNKKSGQTSSSTAPQAAPLEEKQYSNCKLHAADPNSPVCNGPLCPLHARASLCYSRRCNVHGQGGNGRGGRR